MKLPLAMYLGWMAFSVSADALAAWAGWGTFDKADVQGYAHLSVGYWGYHFMVGAWKKVLREADND